MRLGGPVYGDVSDPDRWVAAVRRAGYSAAYYPAGAGDDDLIRAYAKGAQAGDIIIAEVGAWSNPLSRNVDIARAALGKCRKHLALAEKIGACCCVNISGSRGEKWDGPDPDNLTDATFDLIVETVRKIIDAVKPTRTFYTLETMPWTYPDSPENYLRLIKAIDRKQFAVHFDPVNLICSPQRFFANTALIRDCFAVLGPYIRSCHAKDISLSGKLTTHLDEVRPGLGALDYGVYLQELNKLEPDVPLMLEHLANAEEYALAASYIKAVASELGLEFK